MKRGWSWEQAPDNSTTSTWQSARFTIGSCVNKQIVGGRRGWRLPSLVELSSLVDTANFNNPA